MKKSFFLCFSCILLFYPVSCRAKISTRLPKRGTWIRYKILDRSRRFHTFEKIVGKYNKAGKKIDLSKSLIITRLGGNNVNAYIIVVSATDFHRGDGIHNLL